MYIKCFLGYLKRSNSSASQSGPANVVHAVMQRGLQIPGRLDHQQDDVHLRAGVDIQNRKSGMICVISRIKMHVRVTVEDLLSGKIQRETDLNWWESSPGEWAVPVRTILVSLLNSHTFGSEKTQFPYISG